MGGTSAERIQRIRDEIRSTNADAFLLFNHELSGQPGTRYLSGFSGTESVLLIGEKEKSIFTDGRYLSQTKEECGDFELMPTRWASFWEDFEKICRKLNLKKLVVDPARTGYGSILKLNEKLKDVSVTGAENILQKIRAVKDETELLQIKKAANIAMEAFEEFLPSVKEGITEKELAVKLETSIREKGAEKISFDLIVVSGNNGAKPHGKPSDKKITKGELITFDFGCFFNGYASDVTRTIAVGRVSEKLAEIYETVKTAQELGLKAAKAGISGAELDEICRSYVSGKGYGDYFLHGTGHGLGREVHELPYGAADNKEPMPENSVITIEPGIYIEGVGGARIEDTVVLKKNGNINLCGNLGKNLEVLSLS